MPHSVGRPPNNSFPWEDIKNAYLLGESSGVIAERYPGLKPGTIRSRASREKWTTPRNISAKLTERVNKVHADRLRGDISESESQNKLAELDRVADTIASRQAAHREAIQNITREKFKGHKLPPIKTWKDADIADKMARRALDLDKDTPDAIINVGILHGNGIEDTHIPEPAETSVQAEVILEDRVDGEDE